MIYTVCYSIDDLMIDDGIFNYFLFTPVCLAYYVFYTLHNLFIYFYTICSLIFLYGVWAATLSIFVLS